MKYVVYCVEFGAAKEYFENKEEAINTAREEAGDWYEVVVDSADALCHELRRASL